MKLWIDESDGKSFFVSVPTVNVDEYLSFDWTTKGHRAMIQKLSGSGIQSPKDRKPDGEWDTLMIDCGRLIEKQHNVWYDFGKNDLVDGENWEQMQEWPLGETEAVKILKLTHQITEHQNDTQSVSAQIKELEELISKEADRLSVKLPK
ncbi:hypothetical protein KJ925_02555 [Patescibacteria group bacterium]|nr:hypothetical protein [Patescibacteria group bacterium]